MATTQTPSLIRKLCEVMAAVDRIPKRGYNDFHRYHYAMEADVVDAVRDELAQRNIMMFMSQDSQSIRETATKSGAVEFLVDIEATFTFVDGDTGERESFKVGGCGQDRGDKAIYKALTGAQKYALVKTFLIPTGDDPEDDSGQDKAGKGKSGATKPPAATKPPSAPSPAESPPAQPSGQPVNPEALIGKAEVDRLLALAAEKKWTNAAAKGVLKRYGYATSGAVKHKDYAAICAELAKGPAPFEGNDAPTPTPEELRGRIGDMVGEMGNWVPEVWAGILESLSAFSGTDGKQVAGVRSIADLSDKRTYPTYGKVKEAYQAWQARQQPTPVTPERQQQAEFGGV